MTAIEDGNVSIWSRLAGGIGLLAGPLIIAGIWVIPVTDTTQATSQQMAAYYAGTDLRIRSTALLIGLGVLGLLGFGVRVATAYRRTIEDDGGLPPLIVAGALGTAVLLLVSVGSFIAEAHIGRAGAEMSAIHGVEEIGHLNFHVLGVPLALFVGATAVALRRSNLAPGWLGVAGLVVAPLAFVHGIAFLERTGGDQTVHGVGLLGLHLAFLWLFAVGIALVRRASLRQPALRPLATPA